MRCNAIIMSKQSSNNFINMRFFFLVLSFFLMIACYIYASVPLGYLIVAFVIGIIDFPLTVWHWRHPNRIKFYCLIILMVFSQQEADDVFLESGTGLLTFSFWHPLLFYVSTCSSTFFVLLVVFKKSVVRYLGIKERGR